MGSTIVDRMIHSLRYGDRMSSPDPTTRTPKGEATRERILIAAAGLMYDQGVAVTSIDDVKAAVAAYRERIGWTR